MDHEIATRLTNALIQQSTTGERVAVALERLERRLAVPQSAPPGLAKFAAVQFTVVVALAALVGACTALAWPS